MNPNLSKLKALYGRLKQTVSVSPMIVSDHFENMRDQFISESSKVIAVHSELSDFKPQTYGISEPSGKMRYYQWGGIALMTDIQYFIDYLQSIEEIQLPSLQVSEEGVYLAGQHFDALLKINDLVTKATIELVLIDNYVDGKLLDLLGSKAPGVKCRVLTKAAAINPAFKVLITAFNGQHGNLEVRSSAVFHDRFLVLDQKNFYHFGASLKDAGRKGFMFSKIEQESMKNTFWTEFESEWAAGGPSII